MKNLPVNLSELQLALENHDAGLGLHTYWFDTQTGEVMITKNGGEQTKPQNLRRMLSLLFVCRFGSVLLL